MTFDLNWLTPWLATCGQITPADVPAVAAHGFASIINNRPDNEETSQPAQTDIQRMAETCGVQYSYLPVVMGQMTDDQVQEFSRLLSDLPRPVLAFCRSGGRVAALYQLTLEKNPR